LININQVTRHHIPDESRLQGRCRENLKSHKSELPDQSQVTRKKGPAPGAARWGLRSTSCVISRDRFTPERNAECLRFHYNMHRNEPGFGQNEAAGDTAQLCALLNTVQNFSLLLNEPYFLISPLLNCFRSLSYVGILPLLEGSAALMTQTIN
jgi:hypothetical protein